MASETDFLDHVAVELQRDVLETRRRLHTLEVEEQPPRVRDLLLVVRNFRVEFDRQPYPVRQHRPMDVLQRGQPPGGGVESRFSNVRWLRRLVASVISDSRRRYLTPGTARCPATGTGGGRNGCWGGERGARAGDELAGRVLLGEHREQPRRGRAVGVAAELLVHEHREVASLPQRVVAVAARRMLADDRLVHGDHLVDLGDGRFVRVVADGVLLFERARVHRPRGGGRGSRAQARRDQQNRLPWPAPPEVGIS